MQVNALLLVGVNALLLFSHHIHTYEPPSALQLHVGGSSICFPRAALVEVTRKVLLERKGAGGGGDNWGVSQQHHVLK